jgi:hypothetical protein
MSLSDWGVLGVVATTLISFVAYAYWGVAANDPAQLSVGAYMLPELSLAQPKQQPEGTPTSTKSPSSDTAAPDQTPSSEDVSTTLTDSEPTNAGAGPVSPTETPQMGGTISSSDALSQPLPDRSSTVSTPTDSCSSRFSCADLPRRIPDRTDAAHQGVPSCTGNNGEASCAEEKDKKSKEKDKKSKEKDKKSKEKDKKSKEKDKKSKEKDKKSKEKPPK